MPWRTVIIVQSPSLFVATWLFFHVFPTPQSSQNICLKNQGCPALCSHTWSRKSVTFLNNLRLSGVSDPHSWERSCTIFPQRSCSLIWTASEFLRDLLTGPSPRVLDSDDLARDPIFEFLSDGDALGWGPHFGNHYSPALGRGMLMSIGHCIISFHCERNSWASCLEKLRRTKRTSGEQKKHIS